MMASMGLWLHCGVYLAGLAGALLLGLRASRGQRSAVAFSIAGALWLLVCLLLEHRQELAVRLASRLLPIGDQILFLEVWIAWPVAFMLVALCRWLPRGGDRRAVRVLLYLVLAVACLTAGMIAGWPHDGLKGAVNGDEICLQTVNYTCGPASAVNFLRLAGIPATEQEMASACGVLPLRGVTMAGAWWGVEKKLEGTSLRADLERLSLPELEGLDGPCMLSIKHGFLLNHMVVFLRFSEYGAEVIDPLKGRVWWPREELARRWQGVAIVLRRVDG